MGDWSLAGVSGVLDGLKNIDLTDVTRNWENGHKFWGPGLSVMTGGSVTLLFYRCTGNKKLSVSAGVLTGACCFAAKAYIFKDNLMFPAFTLGVIAIGGADLSIRIVFGVCHKAASVVGRIFFCFKKEQNDLDRMCLTDNELSLTEEDDNKSTDILPTGSNTSEKNEEEISKEIGDPTIEGDEIL